MKQFSIKILSSVLSLILVFSTLSFAVEKHECGGEITDVSLFGESDKCSPDMEKSNLLLHKHDGFNKQICCKDLTQTIQSNIVVEKSVKSVDIQVVDFAPSFEIKIKLFEGLAENIIPFQYYIPQKIITDIPVLHQSFLI